MFEAGKIISEWRAGDTEGRVLSSVGRQHVRTDPAPPPPTLSGMAFFASRAM